MSEDDREADKGSPASRQATPSTGPETIAARAVRTTRGRSATTIQVEVERQGGAGAKDSSKVEEVVAELPTADDDEGAPRWEEQPLDRAGDEVGADGAQRARYVTTRYAESDASKFGIRIKLKSAGSTVAEEEIRVREADKPEDPGS